MVRTGIHWISRFYAVLSGTNLNAVNHVSSIQNQRSSPAIFASRIMVVMMPILDPFFTSTRLSIPYAICFMDGLFIYILVIYGVHVGKCSRHGVYGHSLKEEKKEIVVNLIPESVWVNCNISLTWIEANWGSFPLLTNDSRLWSQWGGDEIYPDLSRSLCNHSSKSRLICMRGCTYCDCADRRPLFLEINQGEGTATNLWTMENQLENHQFY